jgi:2-succinyl-6-hydroxy-2,4-cyclohexadiene-1-carboxylate synthase
LPLINVNGLDYFYQEQGEGPPLLLLHGFTGSAANWCEQLLPFAAQHRVLTIDLPGHGRTSSPPTPDRYTMQAVCKDLISIFEILNLSALNLLGYSMGGRLALYVAATQPAFLHSLILESASPGLEAIDQRLARIESDERLANEIEAYGISAFVERWQRLPLFATQERMPKEKRNHLNSQRLSNNASALANTLRGMGTGRQPSLWSQLDTIYLPVLLLAGELDEKYVALARQMEAALPQAQLQVFSDAGHNIHLEKPENFTDHVLAFLASLRATDRY